VGIKPDLITVAKALAMVSPWEDCSSVPFQAGLWHAGYHNSVATTWPVLLVWLVLVVMDTEHLVENAARVGDYLLEKLTSNALYQRSQG
jgi:4-aminobutyrate aminotransferase-like enzyme